MLKHISKYLPVFEKGLFTSLLFLTFFVPLFLKFPLVAIPGSFVSIRLEDVLIGLYYFAFGAYLVLSGKTRSFVSDLVVKAFAVFFFVGAVSIFSGAFLTHTVSFPIGLLHLLRRLEVMAFFPIVVFLVNTKDRKNTLALSLLVVAVVTIVYGLGQKYLSFPVVSTTNQSLSKGVVYFLGEGDRVGSTFAGHYDFAIFLMMILPAILTTCLFLAYGKVQKSKRFKSGAIIFLILLFAFAFLALMLTAARLSFLAALLGIAIALVLAGKKRLILYLCILVGLAALYPSHLRDRYVSTIRININRTWQGFTALDSEQDERSQLNISTLPSGEFTERDFGGGAADIVPGEPTNTTDLGVYRSFDIRLRAEWPRALRAFVKNPLLGTGYSSIGLATDNDLLRALGETGLLGTTAFVLVLISVFRRIKKRLKNSNGFDHYLVAGLIAGFIAFLINSLVIDVFEASKAATIFWIMTGLAVSNPKS